MSDADTTFDAETAAVPTDPAAPPFEPVPPTEPMPDDESMQAAAVVAPEPPATVEPAAPIEPPAPIEAPGPPPPTAEELAAIAASAPTPTAEELAALAAAVEVAEPLPGVGLTDTSMDDVAAAPAGPLQPARAHRRRLGGWLWRLVTSLFALALFAGGVALGVSAYQRVQPPPPVVGDPSTGGVPTPPVVKELAAALKSNDADSLRSAVPADPYRLLTGELQSWQIQGVTSVETLATMQDGPRSATEIIITGKAPNGDARVFNLVVHVNDNQIVDFR